MSHRTCALAITDPFTAVAYLRRLPGLDTDAARRTITELVTYAAQLGFDLAGVYYERRPSERPDTWAELIMSCRCEGIVNVLVPNPEHFHSDPVVAAFMREELADKIRGTVWYADEATATNSLAVVEAGTRDQ